ncbi:hypothetical protein D9758_008867 [Tetrapyrgos nigripes]|uniref:HSF-type DNA-binding domain-containing protein n=1 Tax=Tetrapyrgos nigripes TaxID=182062 RepID=A0A8H5CNF2_9AGAR|nr:hypothetical protein D9758_008867 [Tetrapyrgos nigripes]
MANKRQVALTPSSSYGAPTINTRVPMFLQKLYKIVSDPATNDVICWSDSGDSFFVHDHERLAKEHLGNWFKHNKFASFVRQLNMYGFHKIPHLQQGVLKSDSDAEHSQFAHPDFHRGQEDRLIFIERKKQTGSAREQGVIDFPSSSQPNPAQNSLPPNQALDIHSIVSGIAAIRRHQNSISAELNELKRSNQILWQESMEARNRYQKQQDTINRIVKFLAGVFGHHTNSSPRDSKQGDSPSHSVVPGARLMIEDTKRDSGPKVGIVEVRDEDNVSPVEVFSRETSPFVTVETPADTTVSRATSRPPSDAPSPLMSSFTVNTPGHDGTPRQDYPTSPTETATSNNNSIISTQPRYSTSGMLNDSNLPFSPSHSPIADERIQEALNKLSPGDLQQFIASLSQMPGPDINPDINGDGSGNAQISHLSPAQLTPYKGSFDFGSYSHEPSPGNIDQFSDNLISFDTPTSLEQSWKASGDIDKEVNTLNAGIDSLMETLGLDPSAFLDVEGMGDGTNLSEDPAALLDTSLTTGNGLVHPPPNSDEIFNSFMNTFSTDMTNAPGPPTASDGPPSPFTVQTPDAEAQMAGRSRKRKSDAGLDPLKLHIPSNKAKKRKEK